MSTLPKVTFLFAVSSAVLSSSIASAGLFQGDKGMSAPATNDDTSNQGNPNDYFHLSARAAEQSKQLEAKKSDDPNADYKLSRTERLTLVNRLESFAPGYTTNRNTTDLDGMTYNELRAKMVDIQVEKFEAMAKAGEDCSSGNCGAEKSANYARYEEIRKDLHAVNERIEKFDEKNVKSYIPLSREAAILYKRSSLYADRSLTIWDDQPCKSLMNSGKRKLNPREAAAYLACKSESSAAERLGNTLELEGDRITPAHDNLKRNKTDMDKMTKDELLAKMVDVQTEKLYGNDKQQSAAAYDAELKKLDEKLLAFNTPKGPAQVVASKITATPDVPKVKAKKIEDLEDEEVLQDGTQLLDIAGWNSETKVAWDGNSKRDNCRITIKPVNSVKELDELQRGVKANAWKVLRGQIYEGETVSPAFGVDMTRDAGEVAGGQPRKMSVLEDRCYPVADIFKPACRLQISRLGTYKAPDSVTLRSSDGKIATVFGEGSSGLLRCLDRYSFDTRVKGSPAGADESASVANSPTVSK